MLWNGLQLEFSCFPVPSKMDRHNTEFGTNSGQTCNTICEFLFSFINEKLKQFGELLILSQ